MTHILCTWLNDELEVSKKIDPFTFAKDFSTGYIIGEVLNKCGLQDDFLQFSQNTTTDSKVNNFTRVEKTLHLLEVPFDTNVARDIMTEKPGAATTLMYQMFVALQRKEKSNLTGVAMETMRPAAPVKLETVESVMYQERLKHLTPRQTDLNLDALVARFHEKQLKMEAVAFKERFEEQQRLLDKQQHERQARLERSREQKAQQSEIMAKIEAATVEIPKPPPNKSAKAIARRRIQRKVKEAEDTKQSIWEFEEKMKMVLPPSKTFDETADDTKKEEKIDPLNYIRIKSNDEYIGKIKKRLEEDASAREEREKRRRKVLVDQLKSHEAQEEARREEMLVNRLMRQSQQERRIAVQLLQARHEKEVIRKNRIFREKQYEERRMKDFVDAMDREAEVARLARLEYEEQTKEDKILHDKIAAERAEAKYQKHYNTCMDVINQMVDFTCKVAEYRELTEDLIPAKLYREWRALFTEGKPLYEVLPESAPEADEITPEQVLEEERQQLLDEGDFLEYKEMRGEWAPPESCEIQGPPRNNPVVGHIVQRLFNIVYPPTPPPPPPEFPPFPIKACVLGKVFSGKTTCVKALAQSHRLQVLNVDDLVSEAIEAYRNGEVEEIEEEPIEETKSETAETTKAGTPAEMAAPGTAGTDKSAKSVEDSNKITEEVAEEKEAGEEKKDEETEKTDPEKPVDEKREGSELAPSTSEENPNTAKALSAKSSTSKKSVKPAKPQPTARAKLGSKASKLLKKGKPVDDQCMVDILTEAIRRIPEGTGWVIDGFPMTYGQVKLLEKALSGFEATEKEKSKTNLKPTKGKKSQFAPDHNFIPPFRRIPEGTGWVIDGFPMTYGQAKLLEKALSGFDATEKEKSKTNLKPTKGKKSQLAPDPRPAPPPPEPTSGINVVVLFDIPDELGIKRSAGRTCAMQEDEVYQQEFKPPPEGSATGIGKQERVIPVQDAAHDQEQIQHRITGFLDSWPKIEKWYNKFGILRKVDATLAVDVLFLEVEKILEDTLRKLQGVEEDESMPVEVTTETEVKEEKPPEAEPAPEGEAPPTEPTKEVEEEKRSRPGSRKSRTGSGKRSGSRGSGKDSPGRGKSPKSKDKSVSPKRAGSGRQKSSDSSGKRTPKGSRGSSLKGSAKRGRSGKKGKTPEPEPEPEVEEPTGPPPPEPGSDEWEYVDQPVEENLAEVLAPYWEVVENTYVSGSKEAFRKIRDERESIIRYFYQIRQDFITFLHRPDHKQEFVAQWQKEYNDVADDMRDDEETRAELHERVDDLRERLWSICDERKDQAEEERRMIMNDGWLDDRLGVLSNYYITVMQAELDRFQDTLRLLKDYYRGMEGFIPEELKEEYNRIPLIEIPPLERPASPDKSVVSEGGAGSEESPKKETSKSTTPTGKKGKGKEEKTDEVDGEEGEKKPRIPLVPRRPLSPDQNQPGLAAGGKDKKDKKGGKKDRQPTAEEREEQPPPPADPDDRLIYDALWTAIHGISAMIGAEEAARELEEEAEREREAQKEREKAAAAAKTAKGKGKGGKKSRSPSPKKKKDPAPTETPPPQDEEESEEEKEKKRIKEKMRQEFFFAIKEEADACKIRMNLVKQLAGGVLQDLKGKGETSFKDMDDWLGARFLREMESIDHMSQIMRDAIEQGEPVRNELVLQQEDFIIASDVKAVKSPSPPPTPSPVEQPMSDQFTVDQLNMIYNQFVKVAPTGVLSTKSFMDTFQDLTNLTQGMEIMPDIWMNVTSNQLQEMGAMVSPDSEYVDWRAFLLAASHPWRIPTQAELLDTLAKYKDMDQKDTGYVTREQFDRVDLWFTSIPTPVPEPSPTIGVEEGEEKPPVEGEGEEVIEEIKLEIVGEAIEEEDKVPSPEPPKYDRLGNLKAASFDYFTNHTMSPPQVNYVDMLMYFAATEDPYEGFLRALSIASGVHMPRPRMLQGPQPSFSSSTDLEQERPVIQEEVIPEEATEAEVPLDALMRVFHHGERDAGDSHRFAVATDPEDALSKERMAGVFQELGSENLDPVPFKVLKEHPIIQDILSTFNKFKQPDLKSVLSSQVADNIDTHSTKTID